MRFWKSRAKVEPLILQNTKYPTFIVHIVLMPRETHTVRHAYLDYTSWNKSATSNRGRNNSESVLGKLVIAENINYIMCGHFLVVIFQRREGSNQRHYQISLPSCRDLWIWKTLFKIMIRRSGWVRHQNETVLKAVKIASSKTAKGISNITKDCTTGKWSLLTRRIIFFSFWLVTIFTRKWRKTSFNWKCFLKNWF